MLVSHIGERISLPGRFDVPVAKLDPAKREIVAARFYKIPAEAITKRGDHQG